MSDKILVLFVFHKYDNIVANFFNKCIFKDDNITLKNLLGVKGESNQATFPKENLIDEIKKFI